VVRGRPVGDRSARQAEVAKVVMDVVARAGFEGASMRAIAAEGGFSTGVLRHYFRNHEELLVFSVDHIFAGVEGDIEEAIASHPPLAAIVVICQEVLPNSAARRTQWAVWTNFLARATRDKGFRQKVKERSLRTRTLVYELLELGVNDGSICPGADLEATTDLLLALVEGIGVLSSIHKSRYSRERQGELIEQVLDTVRQSPGATLR